MLGSVHIERMTMPWYVSSHTTINLTLSVLEYILRQAQFRLFDMLGSAHVERMIMKVNEHIEQRV